MAMRPPATGAQVYLHIARTRRVGADLDHRAEKIRPTAGAGKAGVKNADRFSVRRLEPGAAQALM